MKERPILFNDAMVRALLDGRKTQTRRLVKPQPEMVTACSIQPWEGNPGALMRLLEKNKRGCPYGQPGDRLWVRETWQGPLVTEDEMKDDPSWAKDLSAYEDPQHCVYRASGDSCEFFDATKDEVVSRWKPSIHMPRWACRLLLEVTAVRVEPLQNITEDDAIAEGCDNSNTESAQEYGWYEKPRRAFRRVWEQINGTDCWDANPWVWVVEFRRIDQQ